ncbi:MAG: hypothetical protein EPN25_03960 [Nitrospirae bacterium]|nr:MAG: hypothetical protein EPN25_03960 [Nitrospirota bacterium]
MDLIQKIIRRSVLVLVPLAAASSLIEWWRFPLGVLAGGGLALANIKGLAWAVQGLLGTQRATLGMLFFSQFRFFALFIILALLASFRLVNIYGVFAGFTVVFGVVMVEGYRHAKTG